MGKADHYDTHLPESRQWNVQTMTLRDQAWNIALRYLADKGKFKLAELPFKETERHTVKRVLREMEEYGWIQRESKQSGIYRLGPTAEQYLNVDEEIIEAAKS
ncbi:hypothetical protein [Halogeometricum luteum]|uniref:Uncharacterized protein n=1 Tax=Halogeometricum luteum TaxID=2950537 RepID=A0ABU2G4Q9_9EURY|nr:hypothetical protein [Halogeometricum sp. S3BR5-2]MDS0295777.1 hypothetical protein [Halogeometricum sp. S3BR5-2]